MGTGVKIAGKVLEKSTLVKRIQEESDFIKSIIDSIPPWFYFDEETCSRINTLKEERMKKKLSFLGKKRNFKPLSSKTLLKRAKFDPEEFQTVTQIIESNIIEEDTSKNGWLPSQGFSSLLINRTAAQQRLHHKLKELRTKRPEKNPNGVLECRRMKRRISKLKLKEKRRLEKQKAGGALSSNETNSVDLKAKPSFNKEEKMVFNKFDFTEVGKGEKKHSGTSKKDYKQLLTKVVKENEKLKKLKEKQPEKAKEIEEKKVWTKAIQRVQGEKVKDDPQLLKKALKKKEKRKKKTLKEWEGRKEKLEEKMDRRQKKRTANLKKKKVEKVKKKIKRATKKGRYIPV